ncbi:MAG: LAGLIDADG family homing endonuclease [Acidobacteriota bacterium]
MATGTIGEIQKTNGKVEEGFAPDAETAHSSESVGINILNELGQKIFLDRYAVKDAKKRTLAIGDLVIVCVDDKTGQREIGTIVEYDPLASGGVGKVHVELKDGTIVERLTEHISKPIETAPEQMMERVARGIAAIEGAQADAWYERFRWLLNGWKFVPAGRILTAAGTDQQLTFYNCMPPEQEILTANGYQPIAEVNVGDYVVTHRNRLRKVLHKFERETAEPMYIIKAKKLGYDDLRVTGEHKILAIKSEWVNTHRSRDGLKLQQPAEWIPAKELKPNDFIAAAYDAEQAPVQAIIISEYISGYQVSDGKLFKPQARSDYHGYLEEGGTKYALNNRLIVDRDLCFLFGRWLGDGCVTHRTKTDIPSGIKIVFGLDEREDAERLARIIEDKFGVPTAIKMSSTERWLDLWANSMPLGQFFKAFLGSYSYGKRIPSHLLRMPDELTLELLKGLFTADGYTSDNKLGILLSNRTLATQVHQLLMRLGYFFSIKENTHRLGKRPAYRLQATANECADLFKDFFGKQAPTAEIDLKYYFEHDGLRWARIAEIAVEDYSGAVLDLEVEEDHSFVSAGIVVSNCYVVPSPRDSRRGIVETLSQMMEIMSRGGGVGINVSSLRPRHSYVKGVNGRSSGSVSWGGLYSFVTGLIEQGGCLTPESLVFTEKGLLRLDEIVTHQEQGWREHDLIMMTDEGERLSRQAFNNGIADVLTIKTDAGLSLTGTPNHKVKVMTDSGAVWRRVDELKPGDAMMVTLGQHQGTLQRLRKPEYHHHNQDPVEFPETLDEELAFFLGYFAGDGFMTQRKGDWRLGVAVSHDSYLIDEMPMLIERLFKGAQVRVQQKENDASLIYVISNRAVKEFLTSNGFNKAKSAEVSVPRLIRQSPPSVVSAYLRGLFEADGSVSHHYPMLTSTSKRLIDEVATLLIGLGCPVKIEPQPMGANHYGDKPLWRLRINSFKGLESWQANIGCDARSRFATCLSFAPDTNRETSYKLPEANYWLEPVLAAKALPQIDHQAAGKRIKATDQALRRKLQRYTRGDRNLTLSAYANLYHRHQAFAENAPPINDTWFVYVKAVQKAGRQLTLDIEVDDNHTYLANGMVTHNSRRGALMLILNCWHPDVFEFINAKRDMGKINNANISVGITDKFMDAVHADADWDLVFPDTSYDDYEEVWDGNLDKWQAMGRNVITYKTVKAREIWDTIIQSAWASAEPGVFFIERANKDSNSWYYDSGYLGCTNPCGEQPLPGFGVCNLGAINLSKFVQDGEVQWDDLGKAVRYAVRFLDNVIDATPYFFDENYKQQNAERRVGLNTMGLAEMLIRLGIRYGSDESTEFIERLYRFIASNSYKASADIAAEKGAFPMFDAEKFLQSGYMQRMPEDIRQMVREKGMRNVTLLTQAPNGCVTPDTLVFADGGLRPIATLGDADGEQWQDIALTTHSDTGAKAVNKFYVNGYQEVVEIATARGFNLAATLQHRVRVIDCEGNYEWKQMGEVQPGDVLVMARGGLGRAEVPTLAAVSTRKRRSTLRLPEMLTAELAELLGFYIGDGYLKERRGLGIAVDARDTDVVGRLQELIGRTFNLDAKVEDTERNCLLVWAASYFIPRWLRANGLAKANALDAHIPEAVLAGGAATVSAFLRGLFESDGSISNGVISFVSASERLAREVQIALLGLGIVSTRRSLEPEAGRYGASLRHEVRVLNSSEVLRFRDSVGFVSQRKQALLDACEDRGSRADSIPAALLKKLYDESAGLPTTIRQEIASAIKSGMTQEKWRSLASANPALGNLPSAYLLAGSLFFDVAANIQLSESFTFDLSVPDTNTYVANGIVAHNTIGTMVGTSTGIEPFYFWSYFRKSRLGSHEERVKVLEEWQTAHPNEALPDYFVTAMDLAPEEHVKVQAAIQRWVDSSISKTCNLPNNYTVDQTREIYELLYKLGCKGGTIYRDGSRDVQVLNLKKEEEKAKSAEVAESPATPATVETQPEIKMVTQIDHAAKPKIRPRPYKRRGCTVSKATPSGTAHITMNDDDESQPFEVFLEIGKAGSDIKAMAEALGRLMSLVLRIESPVSPDERVREIVKQITGIGGARSYGFGKRRVLSLPDAVGQALAENYLGVATGTEEAGQGSVMGVESLLDDPTEKIEQAMAGANGDLCPSCGDSTFVRSEGCHTCYACGYSEC